MTSVFQDGTPLTTAFRKPPITNVKQPFVVLKVSTNLFRVIRIYETCVTEQEAEKAIQALIDAEQRVET